MNESGNFTVLQTHMGSIYSINAIGKEDKLPFHQRNKFLRMVVDILKEMTDFKLLIQNFGFLLITLSNFFAFTAYFPPFLYLIATAKEYSPGSPYPYSWLLSIIGK